MHAPTKLGKHSSLDYDPPFIVNSPLYGVAEDTYLGGVSENEVFT